ncbi:MAG: helix-turn-helix transcriptional regulator [Marinomonas sp.]|nr:helix-turn-helix transcriptional regulator [Marinomonas sp.]
MKVLCWNTNDSVLEHWNTVCPKGFELVQSNSIETSFSLINQNEFDYCFVYLDDNEFSMKVEQVVEIRERYPSLKIIAFPHLRSQSAAIRMLSKGVNGQCSPYIAKEQLKLVLSVIDSGEIWGGKDFIQQLIKQSSTSIEVSDDALFEGADLLSEREISVSHFIAKGLANKEVARELDVTERTVKAHLTAIYKKLHLKDRLSLALLVKKGQSNQENDIALNEQV